MKFLTEERKRSLYRVTGVVSAVLSLLHFAVLGLSVALAQQIDEVNSAYPFYLLPPNITNQINIPFAVVVGVLGFIQLCASLIILCLNSQQLSGYLHFSSTAAFLSAFAIGVTLTTSIVNFNQIVGSQVQYSYIIPTYYVLQVDATLNFLFSVPLLFYACYQSIEDYLVKSNQENEGEREGCLQQLLGKYGWLLGTILLNIATRIALISNLYQFTGIQSTLQDFVFYGVYSDVDPYAFYLIVEVLINIVAFIVLLVHFRMGAESFLKKKQLIVVSTVLTAFQLGSFFFMVVKTSQLYVQYYLDDYVNSNNCIFNDCQEALTFIVEITVYTVVGLLTFVMMVIYVKVFAGMAVGQKAKETLLAQRTTDYIS